VAVLGYDLMLAVAGHAVVGTVTAKDDAARIAHYQYDGSTLGRAGPFHDAAAISRARLDALSVGDPLPAHAAGMFGLASSTVDRTPGEYLALRWHLILAATVVWGGAGVVGTYTYRLRRHIERQRRVVNATASTAAAAVA
ncbi:MAG TPA: hypothetical protein VK324_10770, partial [Tepidisphaeraceae bacterium]|nr:hypothetical protein [Tepidisphaeraceae bacterium]